MGNTTSSHQSSELCEKSTSKSMAANSVSTEKVANVEDTADIAAILKSLNLSYSNPETSLADELNVWETEFTENPKFTLAQSAVSKNDLYSVIGDGTTSVNHQYLFNTEVKTIGSPSFYNNQKSSGRCWMFATSNVLRLHVIKNYNLNPDNFQVSQAYLFFYDKLERANFALDNLIDTADLDLDSRLVSFILSDPVGDGGQWDMVVNILDKYGIVPNEFFPDNAQATSSSTLNYVLKEKIREFALVLRKLKQQNQPVSVTSVVKRSMMKQIYNTIAIFLGTPPKPTDKFVWEYIDKNGNFGSIETTPTEFYKNQVKYPANTYFSLIHDPRNIPNKLYTVDRLNNFSDGRKIQYVNTSLDSMKLAAIKMIKADEPVFFGCDVGKFYSRNSGVLDMNQFQFNLAFGFNLNTTKKERLQTGSSSMTHAMVLTGVHLDAAGKPIRWKIENSWGDEVGDKGYFVMTDDWFNEFVFQIVSSKAFVSKSDYQVFKSQEFSVLPFYDPMGALA